MPYLRFIVRGTGAEEEVPQTLPLCKIDAGPRPLGRHGIVFFQLPVIDHLKFKVMLRWTIIFAIIAVVAGIFGFFGIAAGAASIAKILFFIFIVLFLVSLIGGRGWGRSSDLP